MKHLGFEYSSRQGAKNAKFGKEIFFLCELCVPSAGLRACFAGDIPIILLAA
jgi:hypothetical protein